MVSRTWPEKGYPSLLCKGSQKYNRGKERALCQFNEGVAGQKKGQGGLT